MTAELGTVTAFSGGPGQFDLGEHGGFEQELTRLTSSMDRHRARLAARVGDVGDGALKTCQG